MRSAPRVAALLAVLAAAVGPAARAEPKDFDIPAGNAAETIPVFERQSGADLSYPDARDLRRYTTRPVQGEYEPIEALRLMLHGIGLVAVRGKRYIDVVDCAAATATRRRVCESESPSEPEMEDVLITGSILRGGARGSGNPSLITISSDDVDWRTAGGTLWEALHDQPAVHGSGPTEDTFETGTDAPTNSGRGIGINLRGFGAGATLVLVNGHRLAASGMDAAFTDISNLSSLFVEKTELLADAASAVYGADAVGGVVNFNLRRDFEGLLTQARYGGAAGGALEQREIGQLFGKRWDRVHLVLGMDFRSSGALESSNRRKAHSDHTSFGGTNFDTNLSNPGNVLTPAGMLAIPRGQDGSSLAPSDLIPGPLNLTDRFAHTDIISAQRMGSAYGALHFTPRDNFSVSVDAFASQRRARAASGSLGRALMVPFSNPFARQIATPMAPALVFYDFFDDLGQKTLRATVRTDFFTGSFEYRFSNDWYVGGYARRATERQHQSVDNLVNRDELTVALASDDPAVALNPFGDGSFTSLQTLNRIRTEGHTFARSRTSSLGLDASGPLPKLLGRDVRFGIALDYRDQALRSEVRSGGAGQDGRFSRSRDAFALLTQLDLAAAKRIDLSFSARYETFLGAGDALTSRVEARWQLTDYVTVFANGSDSFRLPPLGQLDEGQNGTVLQGLPDPQSPIGVSTALVEFGKNSGLQPETAQGWSAGVRIDPPLAGVQMRLSYFDARIRNRIESTAFTDRLLQDPELVHIVTRSPTPQQQADVCARTLFFPVPGGPGCTTATIDAILDLRLRNIAVLESRGIELNGMWSLKTVPGTLNVEVNATRIIDYEQAQTPRAAFIERVDTQNQPLDFRLVGTVTWLQGRFAAMATVNFADRYHDRQTGLGRLVRAWTTYDASLGYSFGDQLNARLIATNLFNQSPPFLDNAFAVIGYDPENADIKGRQLSLWVSKSW